MDDVPEDGAEWTQEDFDKFTIFDPISRSGQWEVPFLVGENYHVHWRYSQEWTAAKIRRSRMYEKSDPYF